MSNVYSVNNEIFDDNDFMKDCPNMEFIPTVLPATKRIIAIGDIHGDIELAKRSFKIAKLIDDNLNWIADPPNTIVVQVGDQIDSCRPIPGVYECKERRYQNDKAEDITVLDFFNEMHLKAKEKGGAVYSLLGNHELMNVDGKFNYVSYENYENFKLSDKYEDKDRLNGPNGRKKAFAPGGPVAKMMACTRNSVLIIGSTMFVHAGVLPGLANKMDYLNIDTKSKIKYLNTIIRKWLLKKITLDMKIKKNILVNDIEISPFWTRIYGLIPKKTEMSSNMCSDSFKHALEVFKIGKMVVGHTPQLFTNNEGINGTCYEIDGNKLFRIDGGFSRAFNVFGYNNVVQVLEILDDNVFNIITDYTKTEYIDTGIKEITDNELKKISKIYSQNRIKK